MKTKYNLLIILFFGLIILGLSSCIKKDLDHDLNYNHFDVNYIGPESVTIESFTPVYSQTQLRNILKIKLSYNYRYPGAITRIYKDNKFLLTSYNDTLTVVADLYALAGETHAYQVQQWVDQFKTKMSTPKYFTMY